MGASYKKSLEGGDETPITLPVAIADGGTGQTAQTAAFDALSPTTTAGDFIVNNGSDNVRLAIGTNGQAILADTTLTNKMAWYDQGQAFTPRYTSGKYYTLQIQGTTATNTTSTDTAYFIPYYVQRRATWTGHAVWITSVGTGTGFKIALYDSSNSGHPGAVVTNTAVTHTTLTTGVTLDVAYTAPVSLAPGWYWLALMANGTITMVSTATQNGLGATVGLTALDTGAMGERITSTALTYAGGFTSNPAITYVATSGSIIQALKAQ